MVADCPPYSCLLLLCQSEIPFVAFVVVVCSDAGVILPIVCASVPVSIVSWLINFDNFIPH